MVLWLVLACTSPPALEAPEPVDSGDSSGRTPAKPLEWMTLGPGAGARLGFSVASGMDVNADGYSDVILGCRDASLDYPLGGEAELFLGGPEGPAATPAWTGQGSQPEAHYGESVAGVGDINGDGYADVMVGAARHQNDPGTGKIYLYPGQSDGLAKVAAWTDQSSQTGSWLGRWISPAGDVDADGYADAVVGDKYYDTSALDAGRVVLYRGGASGFGPGPSWEYLGDNAYANLGFSVAGAGDVDGDGFDDVIAGASFSNEAFPLAGRVWLFSGQPGGLSEEPVWTAVGESAYAMLGYPVAGIGDVNGDGYPEVGAGSIRYQELGQGVVWYGGATGLPPTPSWTATGEQVGETFGYGIAGPGDMDGDGFAELLIGARGYSGTFQEEGRVLLYRGGAGGLETTAAWQYSSGQQGATLGSAVAGAGDVNQDGYPDIVVSAEYYDGSSVDMGAVWVFGGML